MKNENDNGMPYYDILVQMQTRHAAHWVLNYVRFEWRMCVGRRRIGPFTEMSQAFAPFPFTSTNGNKVEKKGKWYEQIEWWNTAVAAWWTPCTSDAFQLSFQLLSPSVSSVPHISTLSICGQLKFAPFFPPSEPRKERSIPWRRTNIIAAIPLI